MANSPDAAGAKATAERTYCSEHNDSEPMAGKKQQEKQRKELEKQRNKQTETATQATESHRRPLRWRQRWKHSGRCSRYGTFLREPKERWPGRFARRLIWQVAENQ